MFDILTRACVWLLFNNQKEERGGPMDRLSMTGQGSHRMKRWRDERKLTPARIAASSRFPASQLSVVCCPSSRCYPCPTIYATTPVTIPMRDREIKRSHPTFTTLPKLKHERTKMTPQFAALVFLAHQRLCAFRPPPVRISRLF